MSGRTYIWSKFHNKTTFSQHVRMRLQNEYIQFSAAIGITAIFAMCILEVVF